MRSNPANGRASAAWTLALSLLALPVDASQLNLRWNACWGDGGIRNRDFACDTDSGAELLVVSFAPPFAMTGVTGMEVKVRLAFAGTSIPAWWQLSAITGNCRATSLVTQFTPPQGSIACRDWAGGFASGLTSYSPGTFGNNFAVILAISQVPTAGAANLVAEQEYFVCGFVIDYAATAGPGACGGCTLGACLGASGIEITQANGTTTALIPTSIDDQQVTWQGAAGVGIPSSGPLFCPGVTAARRSTWGSVKAIYH